MRDVHCHILPGVDDGARDMAESLAMLAAAKAAGVTSMVCTPHCRDPYFDYCAMCDAFEMLREKANGFPMALGFEVYQPKLVELGMDWAERLAVRGSRDFLLELPERADKREFDLYERTVFELQGKGLRVIIAHPERCRAIQNDVGIARNLVRMGCRLQASADFVAGGRTGGARKVARRLLDENLYTYIASDAHRVEHYGYLSRALEARKVGGAHLRR